LEIDAEKMTIQRQ